MDCIKCGYCCAHYDVIVPIDPDKGMVVGNLTHKHKNRLCHLLAKDGTCTIHGKPWYKDTSCYHYDYGDGELCQVTPGKATSCQLLKIIERHDPNEKPQFTQDILLLLNEEIVEKNKAALSRRNEKRNPPLYDPKER